MDELFKASLIQVIASDVEPAFIYASFKVRHIISSHNIDYVTNAQKFRFEKALLEYDKLTKEEITEYEQELTKFLEGEPENV